MSVGHLDEERHCCRRPQQGNIPLTYRLIPLTYRLIPLTYRLIPLTWTIVYGRLTHTQVASHPGWNALG
jgi:hypothetical protein